MLYLCCLPICNEGFREKIRFSLFDWALMRPPERQKQLFSQTHDANYPILLNNLDGSSNLLEL